MNTATQTTQTDTTAPQITVEQLQRDICDIKSYVQDNTGAIKAVAQMAMLWLKSPVESVVHYDTVLRALALILDKACYLDDAVDGIAPHLGGDYR